MDVGQLIQTWNWCWQDSLPPTITFPLSTSGGISFSAERSSGGFSLVESAFGSLEVAMEVEEWRWHVWLSNVGIQWSIPQMSQVGIDMLLLPSLEFLEILICFRHSISTADQAFKNSQIYEYQVVETHNRILNLVMNRKKLFEKHSWETKRTQH